MFVNIRVDTVFTPELVAPITLGDKVALLFTCALILLKGVAPQLFLNV